MPIPIRTIILLSTISVISACKSTSDNSQVLPTSSADSSLVQNSSKPVFMYGIPSDSFTLVSGHIKRNGFLSTILLEHGVTMQEIDQITKNSSSVFDVRNIRYGNSYTLFLDRDTIAKARYLVY